MPSHHRKTDRRELERLIWGPLSDIDVPSERKRRGLSDQMEMSSPTFSQHKRREIFQYSQTASKYSQSPNSSPRRPRGPDVGKSIHKAAAASQSSSRSAIVSSQTGRRSLTSAKRINTPFHTHGIYNDTVPTFARKTAHKARSQSQSQKQKPETENSGGTGKIPLKSKSKHAMDRPLEHNDYAPPPNDHGAPRRTHEAVRHKSHAPTVTRKTMHKDGPESRTRKRKSDAQTSAVAGEKLLESRAKKRLGHFLERHYPQPLHDHAMPGRTYDDFRHENYAPSLARKTARKDSPESQTRKRKLEAQMSVSRAMPSESTRKPRLSTPLESNNSVRSLHANAVPWYVDRQPSPLDYAESWAYQIQRPTKPASRKYISKPKSVTTDDITGEHILQPQRTKAARKTSVQHKLAQQSGSGSSADTDSNNSEDETSSDGSEDTASSVSSSAGRQPLDHVHPNVTPVYHEESALKELLKTQPEHDNAIGRPEIAHDISPELRLLNPPNSTPIQDLDTEPVIDLSRPPRLSTCDEKSTSVLGKEGLRTASLSAPMSNSTVKQEPTEALISAFEKISSYTIHFHKTNSLPFLLRNVRAGFRSLCRKLRIDSDRPRALRTPRGVDIQFEYTDPSRVCHIYKAVVPAMECPLCSIFGILPSWEALRRHVRWDHKEVEMEARMHKGARYEIESIVVKMKLQDAPPEGAVREHIHSAKNARDKHSNNPQTYPKATQPRGRNATQLQEDPESMHASSNDSPVPQGQAHPDDVTSNGPSSSETKLESHITRAVTTSSSSRSQSQPRQEPATTKSQHAVTSNETSDSRQPAAPEQYEAPEVQAARFPSPAHPSVERSTAMSQLPLDASPVQLQSPPPPPLSDPHGPSLPVVCPPGHPVSNLALPTTYRPTGPHLYDHLPPLPPDVFEPLSWFILDKEEEIYELTDVLDEDKVMCALWSRWILLNRPYFISNYLLGVETFVEEYWLMIHKAAGWGALRAWLIMLVSKRFLKNIEMVQVLKKYNGLVGNDNWPKAVRDR